MANTTENSLGDDLAEIDAPYYPDPMTGRIVFREPQAAFWFYVQSIANGSQIQPPIPVDPSRPNCNINATIDYFSNLGKTTGLMTVIAVTCFMLCLFGLLLNALILYIIGWHSNNTKSSNIYLFHLSIFDTGTLLVLLFSLFEFLLQAWPFGDSAFGHTTCSIHHALDLVCQIAISLFICAIAADRLFLVLNYAAMRSSFSVRCITISIWTFSLATGAVGPIQQVIQSISSPSQADFFAGGDNDTETFEYPSYIRRGIVVQNFQTYGALSSVCELDSTRVWDYMHTFLITTIHFGIPFTVCSICYGILLYRMRLFSKLHPGMKKHEELVTRRVYAVLLSYTICWIPFYIVIYASENLPCLGIKPWFKIIQRTAIFVAYLQSCSNPFLYAASSDEFRQDFYKRFFMDPSSTDNAAPQPGTQETLLKDTLKS